MRCHTHSTSCLPQHGRGAEEERYKTRRRLIFQSERKDEKALAAAVATVGNHFLLSWFSKDNHGPSTQATCLAYRCDTIDHLQRWSRAYVASSPASLARRQWYQHGRMCRRWRHRHVTIGLAGVGWVASLREGIKPTPTASPWIQSCLTFRYVLVWREAPPLGRCKLSTWQRPVQAAEFNAVVQSWERGVCEMALGRYGKQKCQNGVVDIRRLLCSVDTLTTPNPNSNR